MGGTPLAPQNGNAVIGAYIPNFHNDCFSLFIPTLQKRCRANSQNRLTYWETEGAPPLYASDKKRILRGELQNDKGFLAEYQSPANSFGQEPVVGAPTAVKAVPDFPPTESHSASIPLAKRPGAPDRHGRIESESIQRSESKKQ